jgi:hypothetical protein
MKHSNIWIAGMAEKPNIRPVESRSEIMEIFFIKTSALLIFCSKFALSRI